jgi:AAA family ATP:ADP antiporter
VRPPRLLGGLGLVFRDRYLLLIALLVVLLNWINSTGEFVLADFVQRDAAARVAQTPGLDAGDLITAFYGDFQFWVTLVGLLTQLFLVARIYRWVGLRGALLVHPAIVALGYGLVAIAPLLIGFVPVFTLIRLGEDRGEQHRLLADEHDAPRAVSTGGPRCEVRGQDLRSTPFSGVSATCSRPASCTSASTSSTGRPPNLHASTSSWRSCGSCSRGSSAGSLRARPVRTSSTSRPEAGAIPDLHVLAGQPFRHVLAAETFTDADPGDVLHLHARRHDGQPLPAWMQFYARERIFSGVAPGSGWQELTIVVVASDCRWPRGAEHLRREAAVLTSLACAVEDGWHQVESRERNASAPRSRESFRDRRESIPGGFVKNIPVFDDPERTLSIADALAVAASDVACPDACIGRC